MVVGSPLAPGANETVSVAHDATLRGSGVGPVSELPTLTTPERGRRWAEEDFELTTFTCNPDGPSPGTPDMSAAAARETPQPLRCGLQGICAEPGLEPPTALTLPTCATTTHGTSEHAGAGEGHPDEMSPSARMLHERILALQKRLQSSPAHF